MVPYGIGEAGCPCLIRIFAPVRGKLAAPVIPPDSGTVPDSIRRSKRELAAPNRVVAEPRT